MIYVTDTHPLVFWSSNGKGDWETGRAGSCKRRSRANTPSSCRLSFWRKSTDLWKEKLFAWTCRFVAGPKNSNVPRTFKSRLIPWKSYSNRHPWPPSATRRIEPSSQPHDTCAVRSSPPMNLFKMAIGSIRFGSNRRKSVYASSHYSSPRCLSANNVTNPPLPSRRVADSQPSSIVAVQDLILTTSSLTTPDNS